MAGPAPYDYFLPGPRDGGLVLHRQHDHRSDTVWQHPETSALGSRRSASLTRIEDIHPRIRDGVLRTALGPFITMRQYTVDMTLVTALVERWRPETHTFMFPEGECTITLQDIAILTGLPINGAAVTGPTIRGWSSVTRRLLGRDMVGSRNCQGSFVTTSWLVDEFDSFTRIPDAASDEQIDWAVRAYLLFHLHAWCFSDTNSGQIGLRILPHLEDLTAIGSISWGSAALAHLYREMCLCTMVSQNRRNIGGPLWILQLWAFEYITPLATPPPPQFSQHPASAFTPFQATQTAQTPPPQTPTYLPTVPVFDDSWNFSSLTTPPSQRSRLMEGGYIPMLPGQDPGSSSRPTQSPSQMHFSLDDPWINNLVQDPQPFCDFQGMQAPSFSLGLGLDPSSQAPAPEVDDDDEIEDVASPVADSGERSSGPDGRRYRRLTDSQTSRRVNRGYDMRTRLRSPDRSDFTE
ncbi:protein MAIN-LIKE 2-like [Mercurialis annua]|uniref:protein MAIN-LIKE 2-like n=1 Tax=Mercurialis annua TaxID=3986 RepID=UPI0024ADEC06|nr:protein MAIN-LIKE 2-like [Mercurialis annua]